MPAHNPNIPVARANPPRPPRNKAQLITAIARKLRERNQRRLTWTELITTMNGIAVPQQELIIDALADGRNHLLGTLLIVELTQKQQADAITEATAILADDSADLTELDKIL